MPADSIASTATQYVFRQTTSERLMVAPAVPGDPVGIYLHIPFCAHICSYCDFNTYSGQEALIPHYVDAMVAQIGRQGTALNRTDATTIYIGGGTPSLLEPEQLRRIIAACRDAFHVDPNAEISMEANPKSFDERKAAGFLNAGINRLSLGVQTQHHRGLRVLGRQHEGDDAATAFADARRAGFSNINLDLIFGWPGQTLDAWQNDLDTVLTWPGASESGSVGPEHLSLYSLIVEPGTPMADAVTRGIMQLPDDDATADLYEMAIARMALSGYTHYEVANWAREPGLAARHNLIYWRNGDYPGIGAGAFGHSGSRRTLQHMRPRDFIAAVEAGEDPVSNVEEQPPATAMAETMMLGLRLLSTGVDSVAFATRHGISLDEQYGDVIATQIERGLMERTANGIRLTQRGLMLANDVTAAFLA